jgi:hypothetical protein
VVFVRFCLCQTGAPVCRQAGKKANAIKHLEFQHEVLQLQYKLSKSAFFKNFYQGIILVWFFQILSKNAKIVFF